MELKDIKTGEDLDRYSKFLLEQEAEGEISPEDNYELYNKTFEQVYHHSAFDEDTGDIYNENIENDSFVYSSWFGNDIYVSKNGNVYCMYYFDDAKYLIMDMDMTATELIDSENFDRTTSEVLVYWLYGENYMQERFKDTIREIIVEYEDNPKEFFNKYNTKNRN